MGLRRGRSKGRWIFVIERIRSTVMIPPYYELASMPNRLSSPLTTSILGFVITKPL